MMRFASLAGALIVALSAPARAEDSPAVVPYRPSVSTPADLPAPGWPELEAGWNAAKGGDAARSFSTPLLFKLAWSEQWGILIGTDAYDWQRDFDGTTARSGGNTTVELKYKLPVSDALSLGTEVGVGLPTARPPFGSGKTDWGILGIASLDTEIAHVDVNVGGTHLGGPDEGQGRWQGNWAVDVSHSLPQGFGVTAELSGIVQHGTRAQSQALAALTYNVSRQLVLDFGVVAGLSGASPHWQVLGGLTVQLGHWFLDGPAVAR
jgi:hypothetical protein